MAYAYVIRERGGHRKYLAHYRSDIGATFVSDIRYADFVYDEALARRITEELPLPADAIVVSTVGRDRFTWNPGEVQLCDERSSVSGSRYGPG